MEVPRGHVVAVAQDARYPTFAAVSDRGSYRKAGRDSAAP